MRVFKIIGIILIVAGIAMLVTGSFHFKEKKKVLDTDVVDISTKDCYMAPHYRCCYCFGRNCYFAFGRKKQSFGKQKFMTLCGASTILLLFNRI